MNRAARIMALSLIVLGVGGLLIGETTNGTHALALGVIVFVLSLLPPGGKRVR